MIKKLILLCAVAIVSLFSIPAKALTIHAALTAPASWDYAYKYNATNDEFEFTNNGRTSYSTPAYTRTADLTYYNYTYTGTGGGVLPFEVTMTFNRSNTTWKSVTGGYTSDDPQIGSNNMVGSVIKKIYLKFSNNTNKDIFLYLDFSTTSVTPYFIETYNNNGIGLGSITVGNYYNGSALGRIYLGPYSNYEIYVATTSNLYYFSGFYLDDLGVSAAYTNGYNEGYDQAEIDIGWTDTNSDGYDDTSFGAGYVEGYTAGYAVGYDEGYAQALVDIGWTDANDDGYDDESYQAGLMDQSAFALGYNKGYTDGYMEAEDMATGAALNSGTLMLIGLLVTFGLMLIGFWTKARLFNLLAVAGSVFFITQFSSVPMIILGFGLIIINLAYTFWGWRGGE